jgi:hypothetical protein
MDELPDELLVQIFSFINPNEALKHAVLVSRAWNYVLDSKHMWKTWCAFYDTLVGRVDLAVYDKKHRKKMYKYKDGEHHVVASIGNDSTGNDSTKKSNELKRIWAQKQRFQRLWYHPTPPRSTKYIKPCGGDNSISMAHYDGRKHIFFSSDGEHSQYPTIEVWDVESKSPKSPMSFFKSRKKKSSSTDTSACGKLIKVIDADKSRSRDNFVIDMADNGTAAVVNPTSTSVCSCKAQYAVYFFLICYFRW